MKHTAQTVAEKLQQNGIALFKERSGFPTSQAQRNLEGKTHFADDASLSTRGASIVSCAVLDDGLLFGVVESANVNGNAAYRSVFFDVFGNIVSQSSDAGVPTAKAAQREFWNKADELDSIALTLDGIKAKEKMLTQEIESLRKLAEEMGKGA